MTQKKELINEELNVNVVDCNDMDRISAIVIYNNKFYESDNHQFALQEALLEDSDNILSLDEELKNFDYVADNIDDVANLTSQLDKDGEIFCLDVFEGDNGKYLVAHSKEAMYKHMSILEEYATVHSLKFGCFRELDASEFIIF